jgi:hypothetical protein
VVADIRKTLTVSKQAEQKFSVERFNLRKLNEVEVMKYYQIKISNRFSALENLNGSEGINRAWENIKGNIITSDKKVWSVRIEIT